MSKAVLFVIIGATLVTPALAQNAPAPEATMSPPASAGAPPSPAAGCQAVRFTRADVAPNAGHFMITFHQGSLDAIKACNPNLDVHETPHGVGVVITYGEGGGVVNLPASLKADSASNGRCVNGVTGDVVDVFLYRAQWTGGLPNHIELVEVAPAFFNKTGLLEICRKLTAEQKHNN